MLSHRSHAENHNVSKIVRRTNTPRGVWHTVASIVKHISDETYWVRHLGGTKYKVRAVGRRPSNGSGKARLQKKDAACNDCVFLYQCRVCCLEFRACTYHNLSNLFVFRDQAPFEPRFRDLI